VASSTTSARRLSFVMLSSLVFTPFDEHSKCLSTALNEDSKGLPKGILKDFRKGRRLQRSYDATTPRWAGSGSDRSVPGSRVSLPKSTAVAQTSAPSPGLRSPLIPHHRTLLSSQDRQNDFDRISQIGRTRSLGCSTSTRGTDSMKSRNQSEITHAHATKLPTYTRRQREE
jgi:hypothetical protein